jgi:hypothetical protein
MWLQIIASIFIIYIGHLCWNYIKNRFSKEKNRDLVKIQTRKYQDIIEELTHQKNEINENTKKDTVLHSDSSHLLQEDLEMFMKQLV